MAQCQFLVQNRHQNTWYGRVIAPQSLHFYFSGKRELRRSLSTTDKTSAKRLALDFWVQCQAGFDHLYHSPVMEQPFKNARHFLQWLSQRQSAQGCEGVRYIETTDAFGNKHTIDLISGDAKAEIEHAKWIHENTANIIESLKDDPETLRALLKLYNSHYPEETREPQNITPPSSTDPQSPTPFDEAVDLYLDKLNSQGRKGKQLSKRTILGYQGRLEFWKAHFKSRLVYEISLKELSEIQNWLTRLPVSFSKKGMTVFQAVKNAQDIRTLHLLTLPTHRGQGALRLLDNPLNPTSIIP